MCIRDRRKGAFYGHAIWLDDGDRQRMAESGAAVAHCPTSNLFLGSGLYNFHQNDAYRLALTLATDVGGGSSFSMLRTMGTAHKVARMGGYHLTALRMFYLATRGAAEALGWEDRIGSFVPGGSRLHRAGPGSHTAARPPQRALGDAGRAAVLAGAVGRGSRRGCHLHPGRAGQIRDWRQRLMHL